MKTAYLCWNLPKSMYERPCNGGRDISMRPLILIIVIFFQAISSSALATNESRPNYLVGQDERGIVVSKLFTKPDNKTYFSEVVLPIVPWGTIMKSDFLPARFVEYYHISNGFKASLHPAPANQVLFILKGTLVIEASSGEVREFPPGTAVWVTDTQYETQGHKTWVKGEVDVYAIVVIIDKKRLQERYRKAP